MTRRRIRLKLFSIKFISDQRVIFIPTAPVSVVIPAYNAERFLRQAIDSVYAQSVAAAEIIVVDNNSTDRTRQIAENAGAIIVEEQKQNLSAARNKGIRSSSREWIALLDADDLWERKKIEYQWRAIEACPDAGIILSDFSFLKHGSSFEYVIKRQKNRLSPIKNRVAINKHCSYFSKIDARALDYYGFLPSSAAIHRNVFSGVGMFDETIDYQEDVEFFMRAATRFPFVVIHKPLTRYRLHDGNMSINFKGMEQDLKLLTERMLRFPDCYASGAGEFYRDRIKQLFIRKARSLARQKRSVDGASELS